MTQKDKAAKAKLKQEQREAEMTPTELALEHSEFYRGYYIEQHNEGHVTIRRLVAKKAGKLGAIVYDLGFKKSIGLAKDDIDKAALKFGDIIVEEATLEAVPSKSTNTTTKSTKAKASVIPATNLNQRLRDNSLWEKGMQFLSGEEKQRLLDGDKSVLKVLSKKLKAIYIVPPK